MRRFIAFYLFICFVSIYLLTASGINFYYTDASQMRAQVAKSIVEKSDLSIPKDVAVKGADGRYYSWVGIGSALLAIPFYIIGKSIGIPEIAVLIMNPLFGAAAIIIVFLFCISLGYSRRTSFLVSIFYGLGSMAWPLAKQPFDHPMETFFILLSIYLMYLYVVDKKFSRLLISALSLGFAFIIRPTSILVIPPLFILMIISLSKQSDFKATLKQMTKNTVFFSLALLPFLCLFFWYNYYRFGSIFETGYQLIAVRTGVDLFTGTSLITGLGGFLVSPGKGFFYYSPVAILFFFSVKPFMKKHFRLGLSFILIMISYLLFFSKYVIWHGDFAWGPRYMLAITPLLIIPIAELFESNTWIKKKFLKVIVCSIFTVSVIIQIAAVSVDFQKYFTNLKAEEKITVIQGKGVPPILVPPDETYYNWQKSPLLVQFKFMHEIAEGIKDYRYAVLPDNATDARKMKVDPIMNIFDFWWLYEYYLYGSTWGFAVALVLFLIAIYTTLRLWKLTSMSPQDIRLCIEESKRK